MNPGDLFPTFYPQFSNSTTAITVNNTNLSTTQVSSQGDPTQTVDVKAAKVFFYFFILICSTFGNIVVAWIICSSKKMRTPSNFLILNLSICDLITPLVSIPFDFALEENGYSWFYGEVMCKIAWPCATLTATSSSLTLAVISLDRYRSIMHPFKIRLSSKAIQMIIAAVHLTSLLFVLPYIYVLELNGDNCEEHWPKGFAFRKGYTLVLFLIQYAIPLVFMIVMYALAIESLRISSEQVRKWSIKETVPASIKCRRFAWLKSPNAKATKMFIIIVLVFAVFMFPNQVLWMWLDFGNNASHPYLPTIQVICWLFTYTNSVCNPMIYFIFSHDFRNGLNRLILCCKRCDLTYKGFTIVDSGTVETSNESSFRKLSIMSIRKRSVPHQKPENTTHQFKTTNTKDILTPKVEGRV